MSHNHIIAGDRGYLPTFYDENNYVTATESAQAIKDYVDDLINGIEERPEEKNHPLAKSDHFIDKWYVSGVVNETYLDENENLTMVGFNRELARIDYVEVVGCSESDCENADYESLTHYVYHSDKFWI